MKVFKFLLSLILTVGLGFLCNNQINHDSLPSSIPPIGKLMNPFTGFWQNAKSETSVPEESINLSQLIAPVQVQYDEKMVPHVFAQNEQDAMFIQGYVTAQNRLWQMDFGTRYASGRLSEVLGEQALELDKTQRRRGIFLAAQRAVKEWEKSKEAYELLEAYTNGVNTYIKSLKPKDYPVEFKLMDYQPEPWTVVHSALILKNMSLTLCSRENDLESTNALKYFGKETFDFLYPEYNPKQSPIIPTGTPYDFEPVNTDQKEAAKEMIGYYRHKALEKTDEGIGSNNWAVSGAKTASGNPILCSDPHLRLTLPSVWYEMQIHTPNLNVYGVTLPGLPGIIIGFNENIAWGQTNVGQDVMDWYNIKWADDLKESYIVDGLEKEVQNMVSVITVRGKEEPIRDTIKNTIWGPIVYEDPAHPKQDLAMRWAGVETPSPMEIAFVDLLNRGKNYEDYSNALKHYESPAQNFAFASKDGDIAIKVNGKFPIKREGQGRFVQDGSDSKNAWQGFIPMSQVPQIKNPQRQFIASANQHSTDLTYPYYYFGGFDDYRGRHLVNRLSNMDSITVEDMMALQNDNYSLFAEEATPLLLEHLDSNSLTFIQKSALKELRNWDLKFEKNSIAPVLFSEWWNEFYELTWDEVYAFEDSIEMLYPESWRTLEILDTSSNSHFFDIKSTEKIENAKDIATLSFIKMCEIMSLNLKNPTYNWAEHKGTIISHLGRIPAFSSSPLEVGGYKQALNAISEFNGPSWRMIVELGDEIKAYGVYPGGQSGNPGDPYFDSMLEKWTNGEYYELFFMKYENDDRLPLRCAQKFF
ncbi:MAG: penicillin acylase family protein [Saprospiraceae bacterium]|nr:penicillin acylase family protein [Saprospiraceae bacterium]